MPKMPNRTQSVGGKDASSSTADKIQRKTERSHEENQERAYIAASRRADRSIEARVQSARMASEIHKKRTGKGFRITEEIVMKEEMYEEEEDAFPRSFRLLGPHMQTASAEMNLRMEAYLTNRMAMSAMVAGNNDSWRQNEIHTQFAQFFPDANRQAQQLTQRMSQSAASGQSPGQQQASSNALPHSPLPQSPMSPGFQQINYQQQSQARGGSLSVTSPAAQSPHDGSVMSPQSPSADTTTPSFINPMSTESPMDFGNSSDSAFTSELPAEAKMLMVGSNVDMNDPFGQNLYGQDWTNNDPSFLNFSEDPAIKADDFGTDFQSGMYGDGSMTPIKYEQTEINWGNFVNEDWEGEQQQQQQQH